jgi:hypothetical protein
LQGLHRFDDLGVGLGLLIKYTEDLLNVNLKLIDSIKSL